MDLCSSPIEGLTILSLGEPHGDQRGSFIRLYCQEVLRTACPHIAQISHSFTKERGTVRGMHYQEAPHQEVKVVICLRGSVWDVGVDVRENSPTRYAWHGEELSAENRRAMVLTEGFAHGFQTLEPDTELLYLISTPYCPQAERGLSPLDPALAIEWPLEVCNLSQRDQNHPLLVPYEM